MRRLEFAAMRLFLEEKATWRLRFALDYFENRTHGAQSTMPGKNKSAEASKWSSVAADEPAFSLISHEKLLDLYATMVKCRMLEERLCLFAPRSKASGDGEAEVREASLVGATIDLGRGDAILPFRWQFLASLAKGALPEKTLRRLAARADSGRIRRSSAGLRFESVVRAAQIRKRKRKEKIVVAFAEVGETVVSSWRKSLAAAVRQKLPIVFVVQAGLATEEGGMGASRPGVAVEGLPAVAVDSDDAVAVYRVAYEAIARARRGLGPTLIECQPYRVEARAKGRAAKPRRSPAVEPPQGDDSIANMEIYLRRKGLLAPQARQRIATAFAAELDGVESQVR